MVDPFGLVLLLALCLLMVVSAAGLLVPRSRPSSWAELGVVVAFAAFVALGAALVASTTDPSVAVDGETTYCREGFMDDPLPAEIVDRCHAQREDRTRQMVLAAAGAAISAAGGLCWVTSFEPFGRRRRAA